jgi:hypothetical protein
VSRYRYQPGPGVVAALRVIARSRGAAELELEALERLAAAAATDDDVQRLLPLAELAGLDWRNFRERFAD